MKLKNKLTDGVNKLNFYYMMKRFIVMMLEHDFLCDIGIRIWEAMFVNVAKDRIRTEMRRDLLTPLSAFCQLLKGESQLLLISINLFICSR